LRTGFVYVLHFDVPLSHAMHYSGSTCNIRRRLEQHALGAGSCITKELMRQGIGWRLGSLSVCCFAEMRRCEKILKRQHRSPDYCGICNSVPKRIAETTPMSLELLGIPITSWEIAARKIKEGVRLNNDLRLRFYDNNEPRSTMETIKDLMRSEPGALGFIPVGEKFEAIMHDSGDALAACHQIVIANINGVDRGYVAYTVNRQRTEVTIQQCMVSDEARLNGNGRKMIEFIESVNGSMRMACHVKDSLAANEFWKAIGFELVERNKHKTSGNWLNKYKKAALFNLDGLDGEKQESIHE